MKKITQSLVKPTEKQKTVLQSITKKFTDQVLGQSDIIYQLYIGLQKGFGFSDITICLLDPGTNVTETTYPAEALPLPDSEKKWLIKRTQDQFITPDKSPIDHVFIENRSAALFTDKSQILADRKKYDYACNDCLYWVMISEDELIIGIICIHNWSVKKPIPYPKYKATYITALRSFITKINHAIENLVIHNKIESLLQDKDHLKQRIREDEENLQHRILELEVLYETSTSLGHTINYYEIVSLIMDALHKVLNVDVCTIFLLEFIPGGELFIRINQPVPEDVIKGVQNNILTATMPFSGYPIDRDQVSYTTEKKFTPEEELSASKDKQIKSFANVPLLFKEIVIGMLNVCSTHENAFGKNEMTFLHTMSNHLASHLGRLKMVKELEKSKIGTMVESMAEGVIMLDENNQLENINPAAMGYLGLESQKLTSEILIEKLAELDLISLYYDAIYKGESILNHEVIYKDKMLSANVTPVLDSYKRRIGMVMVLRDMTALFKVTRIKTQRLEVISRVNSIINSITDIDNLLSVLMDFVLSIANAEMGSIQLKENNKFITRVHSNFPDKIRINYKFKNAETLTERTIQKSELIFIEDYPNDPTVEHKTKIAVSEYLCIPILVNNDLLGAVNIVRKQENTAEKITLDDIETLTTITSLSGSAIYNAILFQDIIKKQKLDQELSVAHDIQQKLLPETFPEIKGVSFGALSVPAREIGGDYYDVIPLENGRFGIVIADIVGKGIPAALFMIMFKSVLLANIKSIFSTVESMNVMNQIIYDDPAISKFVPVIYGILDPETLHFTYCNAGHEPGIIFSGDRFTKIDTGNSPLGAWADSEFKEKEIILKKGDIICLFTDGVIEARNEQGKDYGLTRVKSTIKKHRAKDGHDLNEAVYDEIVTFVGEQEQHDDLTMMIVKVTGDDDNTEKDPPIKVKELNVKSSKENVSKVRREVDAITKEMGFSEEEIFNIKLAINEAHANVIEHAYGGNENKDIYFKFFIFSDKLEIIIQDFGRGIDQKTTKTEQHLDELEGSGLGVILIKSLMDEVEYKVSSKVGTKLWLLKYLNKGE